jgi:hypothetical protein
MLNSEKFEEVKNSFVSALSSISSELISWITIVVLHAATIPSLMAIMFGVTDNMPPIDITLIIWTALMLMFIKAAINKNLVNLITVGFGFFVQAALMALIFFK